MKNKIFKRKPNKKANNLVVFDFDVLNSKGNPKRKHNQLNLFKD